LLRSHERGAPPSADLPPQQRGRPRQLPAHLAGNLRENGLRSTLGRPAKPGLLTVPSTGSDYNGVVIRTRLRPKIGTDGRPAVTGEKILYPVAGRKDTVRRTNPASGGHDTVWERPFDSADSLDPRPVIHLEPLVMPDGTIVDVNSPIAFLKPQPHRYRYFKHFDLGLLREVDGVPVFDIWGPETRVWHRMHDFNPFIQSMSPILTGRAEELADGGDLYAPNVQPEAA
jgi:hypothetical protein